MPLARTRRRFGPVLLLAVTAAAVPSAAPAAQEVLAGPVVAQVVRVIDGDSLQVRAHIWPGQHVETVVRLAGVDAPELRGRCPAERDLARAARDFLAARIAATGNTVVLTGIRHDKYGGRVLATVLAGDGGDLAAALDGHGLARLYDGGRRDPWCPPAQAAE
ncbi:thermonuclease family protein [Caenispirillum bisanense]|uniref:thermonuclease family protein n=1 Tax=Caenispirillum bisanense TaxID=414052 RepID=UPI0031DA8F1D